MTTPADIFRAHPLAPEPGELIVPDWRQVDKSVPPDFRDDGSSDPVIVYLLGIFAWMPWCKRTQQVINTAGRRHDYGYGPARLPGSGYEYVTREGWDTMYRENISDGGHPVIARWHFRALRGAGGRAWNNWTATMRRWGWNTYGDFLADTDHKYGFSRATANKDVVL